MKRPGIDRGIAHRLKSSKAAIPAATKNRVAGMPNSEKNATVSSTLTEQIRAARPVHGPAQNLTIHVGEGGSVTLVLGSGPTTVVQAKP